MSKIETFKEILIVLILLILNIRANLEYSLDWAVQIDGDEKIAKEIATFHNLEYLGRIGNLDNMYHFRKNKNEKQRFKRTANQSTTDLLANHNKVIWAEQQKPLIRKKRDFVLPNFESLDNLFYRNRRKREMKTMFNDPKWPDEWYLYDTRFSNENIVYDMQVVPVWKMNITGYGVKLSIIDDGVERKHPDLKVNYDPMCSTDLNDNDDDPTPNIAPGTRNEHGTRCASEISMAPDNGVCGVGIAFNSKIGGIRLLDGPINDILEAKAIGFNNNYIDIYSASWGPDDNGKTMEQPERLTREALYRGANLGRNGKGNLYVFASGNGGYYDDSCICDGYVSSLYVISVNSVSPFNNSPKFIEKCSSTMCATYSSSSSSSNYKIIAADINGTCTTEHSGTSASAPYAAGIFALALEVNPKLTWRDIKHLITWTSQYNSLKHSAGWKKNAAGFWVNSKYGFGLLNAYQMVKYAKFWKTVPELKNCSTQPISGIFISNYKSAKIIVNGRNCAKRISFIENLIIRVNITYSERGALLITLQSPNRMNTTILPIRVNDESNEGIINWPFNTVHNWGERPNGKWIIFIEDKKTDTKLRKGEIKNLKIEFYGTKTLPHHIKTSVKRQRNYRENDRGYLD